MPGTTASCSGSWHCGTSGSATSRPRSASRGRSPATPQMSSSRSCSIVSRAFGATWPSLPGLLPRRLTVGPVRERLIHASDSLISNANLVTKVYFPRVLIPLASILTAIVDSAVAGVMLLGLMVVMHVPFHATAPRAPHRRTSRALCGGLWGSGPRRSTSVTATSVTLLPFFIQIMVYATPVFYPASMVPARYRSCVGPQPNGGRRRWLPGGAVRDDIPFARLGVAHWRRVRRGPPRLRRFRRVEQTFADRSDGGADHPGPRPRQAICPRQDAGAHDPEGGDRRRPQGAARLSRASAGDRELSGR